MIEIDLADKRNPFSEQMPAYYRSASWHNLRDRVLARDRNTCRYCGRPADTADHIKPRKRGGRDSMRNLVAVCHACNTVALGSCFTSFAAKKKWMDREWKLIRKTLKT